MSESNLRERFRDNIGRVEVAIYSMLAVLLALPAQTLRVLNELLVVLMLVEILHTVRISIRSHKLMIAEPFLVVGLIASIRRMLVITLEAATLSREGAWVSEGARAIFHGSMIELGLLGLLVLILVHSIIWLRRNAGAGEEIGEL